MRHDVLEITIRYTETTISYFYRIFLLNLCRIMKNILLKFQKNACIYFPHYECHINIWRDSETWQSRIALLAPSLSIKSINF